MVDSRVVVESAIVDAGAVPCAPRLPAVPGLCQDVDLRYHCGRRYAAGPGGELRSDDQQLVP